jgi:hypothetical protein
MPINVEGETGFVMTQPARYHNGWDIVIEHQRGSRVAQIVKTNGGQTGFLNDPAKISVEIGLFHWGADREWKEQIVFLPALTGKLALDLRFQSISAFSDRQVGELEKPKFHLDKK